MGIQLKVKLPYSLGANVKGTKNSEALASMR